MRRACSCRETRRAWIALAAFNAEVSYVRDHVSQPLPGEIRLQWWRDVLTGEGQGSRGEAEANPVAAELLLAITRYDLPVETFVRLIDAHVFDVYDDPMPDMAALEAIAAIRRQRCTRCVRRCSAQVRLMSRVSLTMPALRRD
jgi:phytoene/squalene synthetase